ncbi:trehalose-phosphatase [Sulfuriflexus sp.]|uniref:trehalose-phosphatase n=1 Tax=Sulfuriflexus sp. TaxID=2015443 RepID=UPI0028CD6163|nr:trehalose-phosphatase [Sulfuriflexus sp.]MDT8404738.1 trehalose-phosphatase [Sulfuriflexus sp.]
MNTAVHDKVLSADHFDAVILDLDGVVTRTASVHADAWKTMFDDFLARHTPAGKDFEPFSINTDYPRYVDGMPRYDGVRTFLKSRNIELPYGNPDDKPDQETICGLGNRKNRLFIKKLRSEGVKVYASSISLIRSLRQAGFRTAVVSSSRNCKEVLEAAGIDNLFDARVDGVELQRLQLAGKPAPDMFAEACRRLASEPRRSIGIEDATAGVQAARAAGIGYVIGVNRGDQAAALYEHGADSVVSDLAELRVQASVGNRSPAHELPSALDALDEIIDRQDRQAALFLDYDGTLTPIVSHPDDAILSEAMRHVLRSLAGLCKLAIVSGRDLNDVRNRVGIDGIWYAGSHGFDIAGPGGNRAEYQQGREYLPALDAAEQTLRARLADVPGCLVERKHFSIATHYRQVAQGQEATVKQAVDETHAGHPELRLTSGKKIFELQPAIDWDKGKAIRWLMQALDLDFIRFTLIYIGDDVTDEDAFRELETQGIGILVTQEQQPTRATYRLDDPAAVEGFLERLSAKLADARA